VTTKEQERILGRWDEEEGNLQCEFLGNKKIIGGNPKVV